MVFSTFRDAVERLLSSFHFGITFGTARPGQITQCELPGGLRRGRWQKSVTEAARRVTMMNDAGGYQHLLRGYLRTCRRAVDNAYVAFLDPNAKSLETALRNLEKYLVVGLQSDMEETLKRWANVTVRSCRDHPRADVIEERLGDALRSELGGSDFRARTSEKRMEDGTPIRYPSLDEMDDDLQDMIREMTAKDQVIYKRVQEMFQLQRMS